MPRKNKYLAVIFTLSILHILFLEVTNLPLFEGLEESNLHRLCLFVLMKVAISTKFEVEPKSAAVLILDNCIIFRRTSVEIIDIEISNHFHWQQLMPVSGSII